MATVETTTLRVPVELRDEIARIAQQRGTTMLDVVTDAIHRLSRDEWWDTVHSGSSNGSKPSVSRSPSNASPRDVGLTPDP